MSHVPLHDVNQSSKNIRIKVRVARCWDFVSNEDNSTIFSFELLLIDEKGETIQATIPQQTSQRFRKSMFHGSICHISGFNVIPRPDKYRISNHPFRIKLPSDAFVKQLDEPDSLIPYDKFNFLDFPAFEQRVGLVEYLSDIFGQLILLENVDQIRLPSNQIRKKRTLIIRDLSANPIQITLWGTIATQFPEEKVIAAAKSEPIIVAFTGMFAKSFGDGFAVNSTSSTKIYVNPNLPEVIDFINNLEEPYTELRIVQKEVTEIGDIEEEKNKNRKTISELLQLDIHADKEVKFTCKATIKEIDPTEGWWYKACPKCKKSLHSIGGRFWCEKHLYIDDLPTPWYKLTVIVQDETGTAPFLLFGHLAQALIEIPAGRIVATTKDRFEVPPIISKICGIEKIFQISISDRVKDADSISFIVDYIFKDEIAIMKEATPNPTSVRSSHLFTQIPVTALSKSKARKKLQFPITEGQSSGTTEFKSTNTVDNVPPDEDIAPLTTKRIKS